MVLPFNIRIMDVDNFIEENKISEVTSSGIKSTTTSEFDPDGLFSETIFGEVGSLQRAITHGYIELNTTILHPFIYEILSSLGGLYVGILSGTMYAIWDSTKRDFVKVFGDPEDTPGANTGFSFFMKHFPHIQFKESSSLRRDTKIDLLDKYRTKCIYSKYLVEPAALRDIQTDETGKLIQDDINKYYQNLLSYAKGMDPHVSETSLYDGLRFNLQKKANEIYAYLENMMTGKKGFLQGTLSSRRIALGTRNVLTSVAYVGKDPDDPQILKPNESAVGVFQAAKAFQPLVVYYLKTLFFQPIFGDESSSYNIVLVNPKNFSNEYVTVDEDERIKWIGSDGLNDIINKFKNIDIRHKPVIIHDEKGKPFYLYLVLDLKDKVYLGSNLDELKEAPEYDLKSVRPITWIELMYIAVYKAIEGKHCHITRYPVLGDGSTYPSKIHLCSTLPGRVIELYADGEPKLLPEYPILGNPYQDTVQVGFERLEGLGADYDGDTVSFNGVLSEEANEECKNYLESPRSLIDSLQRLVRGQLSKVGDLAIYNWTRDPGT